MSCLRFRISTIARLDALGDWRYRRTPGGLGQILLVIPGIAVNRFAWSPEASMTRAITCSPQCNARGQTCAANCRYISSGIKNT